FHRPRLPDPLAPGWLGAPVALLQAEVRQECAAPRLVRGRISRPASRPDRVLRIPKGDVPRETERMAVAPAQELAHAADELRLPGRARPVFLRGGVADDRK